MVYYSQKFFNHTVDIYGDIKPWHYDYFLIDFIDRNLCGKELRLLDTGGGSGLFAKLIARRFKNSKGWCTCISVRSTGYRQ